MTSRSKLRRSATALGTALLCSGVIAACGSSSSTSGSSGSSSSGSGTTTTASHGPGARFADDPTLVSCLKKHGVTLPSGGAGFKGGGTGGPPSGGAPSGSGGAPSGGTGTTPSGRPGGFGAGGNSKFRTALEDCGAGTGTGTGTGTTASST